MHRSWMVRPPSPGCVYGDDVSKLAAFDEKMQQFMQNRGVRSGALAIAKNVSRGSTWAEERYPTTQLSSLFRLASVSKAFACAAIQRLLDQHAIEPTTRVFPFLGITTRTELEDKIGDHAIVEIFGGEIEKVLDQLS
jgi:CubicO group peptidase (beta-lactamase class C family)